MAKILFVLRASPDIDHLVPVISRICTETTHEIKIVGIDPVYEYTDDERIIFLNKTHSLELVSLFSHLPCLIRCQRRILLLLSKITFSGFSLFGKIKDKILNSLNRSTMKSWMPIFLKEFSPDILICDHNRSEIVSRFIKYFRSSGCISVALPHSAENWTNKLRITSWMFPPQNITKTADVAKFDYLIYPNKQMLLMDDSIEESNEKKIILGSARFSKSWVLEKEKLFGSKKYEFAHCSNKTKVLFFFPKKQNNIFWEELIRSIHIICSFDFSIVFKLPVRGQHFFPKEFSKLNNVDLSDEPSGVLVDWADIVFYIDTTVIFEAMIKDKTVVHLKHLHINSSSTDNLRGICRTCTRDDLVKLLENIENEPAYRPYTISETLKILKEVVYPNDSEEPIDDYLNFIDNLLPKKYSNG